jgi:hypothetical protein
MGTSTLEEFRSEVKADIVARLATDSVTGVSVFEFPPGDEAPDTDVLFLGTIRTTQDHLVFGGAREERLTAEVIVFVLTPGAGDVVAAVSEDRAQTILASVENALRGDPGVSSSVFHAQIVSTDCENGVTPEGRFCQLTVTIEAEAHL